MTRYLFPVGLHNVELPSELVGAAPHTDLVDILDRRSEITDQTGVPLESDRKNPPVGLNFEYDICPFKDSPTRFPDGVPSEIPISNLEKRRLTQSYPQIARQLLATREAYLSLMGLNEDHNLTADEGVNILGHYAVLAKLRDRAHKEPKTYRRFFDATCCGGSQLCSRCNWGRRGFCPGPSLA